MILSIISQGLVWAVLGLGIFMTFRILGFPDMTTEGSFPLGRFSSLCCGCSDRSALYQGENSDLAFWDFGHDLLPLYHADADGPCQSGAFRQQ